MSIYVYKVADGNIITRYPSFPEGYVPYLESGQDYIESDEVGSSATHYISDDVLTERPQQSTTLNKTALFPNNQDIITITSAPIGATATLSFNATGESVTGVIDGDDSITVQRFGTYTLSIIKFPYLDFAAQINAA